MPAAGDFRNKPFAINEVKNSGGYVGRTSYAKLYLIENVLRVIIHSVLCAQLDANWWSTAVGETIRKDVEKFKKRYIRRPWHTKPGSHDIYYTQLGHLSEIMRSNRIHFDPIVTDLDQWVVEIERLRLPRNIVAHINLPNTTDSKRIDVFYGDCLELIKQFLTSNLVPLKIP